MTLLPVTGVAILAFVSACSSPDRTVRQGTSESAPTSQELPAPPDASILPAGLTYTIAAFEREHFASGVWCDFKVRLNRRLNRDDIASVANAQRSNTTGCRFIRVFFYPESGELNQFTYFASAIFNPTLEIAFQGFDADGLAIANASSLSDTVGVLGRWLYELIAPHVIVIRRTDGDFVLERHFAAENRGTAGMRHSRFGGSWSTEVLRRSRVGTSWRFDVLPPRVLDLEEYFLLDSAGRLQLWDGDGYALTLSPAPLSMR